MRQYRVLLRQAIRSRRVVTPEGVRPACVVWEGVSILAVEDVDASLGSLPVIDARDWHILPGLVDSHIHINAPGRTEWEGFATATRAAAAGGYTCLVDMPLNSIPATTNVAALNEKRREAAGVCAVDCAFWGGAVNGNAGDLLPLAQAGVAGFKAFLVHPGIEEFSLVGETDLRAAMPVIAQTGLPLLVHAEDPAVISKAQAELSGDPRVYATYLQSRPDEAETRAIQMLVSLCREYRCRVHIVHLASAAAVPILRQAREEGLPISVETCPHYLYFAAEDVRDGATQFKCAPPIRSAENRELLWKALRQGVIDLIATDHSPCPPALKLMREGDFLQAWGGISSLSVALPAVWTTAKKRGFAIDDVVRWLSEKPAELAGIKAKGKIAPGYNADLVVFAAEEPFTVREPDLHFRHPVTPYLGETLTGRVKLTLVRGTCVFQDGVSTGACPGSECTVSEWIPAL